MCPPVVSRMRSQRTSRDDDADLQGSDQSHTSGMDSSGIQPQPKILSEGRVTKRKLKMREEDQTAESGTASAATTPSLCYDKNVPVVIRNLSEALQAKPLMEWTPDEIHQELGILSDEEDDNDDCADSLVESDELAGSDDDSNDSLMDESSGTPAVDVPVTAPAFSPHSSAASDSSTWSASVQSSWVEDNPNIQRNKFIGSGGLKVDFSGNQPYDWWCLLVSDEFLEVIVEETNRQALMIFLDHERPRARISNWKVLTVPEFKVFLGLLFTTGIVKLPTLGMHWQRNLLTDLQFPLTPGFNLYMSRDRFTVILEALHFAKNPSTSAAVANANPLSKIDHLLNYFHTKMHSIYYPHQNLCIDDPLILWRGRFQHLPGKAHKRCVKLYVLTEPSGLVLRFLVYGGRKDRIPFGANHATNVVMKLMFDHLGKGHSLLTADYYSSVSLTETLLKKNTYVTGTLRSRRRGNPGLVKKKLPKDGVASAFTTTGICVVKWGNGKNVTMVTSEFGDKLVEAKTKTRTSKKPECIVKYNTIMGDTDKRDQMLSYYPCEHKSMKWYKSFGIHIFDTLMTNAYLLSHQVSDNPDKRLAFRIKVIEGLLGSADKIVLPITPPSRFKDSFHVAEKAYSINGRAKFNRCKNCLLKKVRKDVSTKCADCVPSTALCLPHCFREWHLKNVYT